jgi:HAD superfamily hydrolase (TIGR01549 family)
MTNTRIKAILFDVGGPLVDDSGMDRWWMNYMLENLPRIIGRQVSQEEIEEATRKVIDSYVPSLYSGIIWHFVQPDIEKFWILRNEFDRHDLSQYYRVRPDAAETCHRLSEEYRLAIAANQPESTARFLENKGILKYFEFKEMSGSMPYSKPDIRFFLYIAAWLEVRAEECLMIGDRQDNDIVPAKRLGMKAIRFRAGTHKDQKVRMPLELPDSEVTSLRELPDAISDLQS